MSDYIILIKDLQIDMYLGLHDFEKEDTQRVLISIDIEVSDVDYTAGRFFDYDNVVDYVRSFNAARIETQEELTRKIYDFVMEAGCKNAKVYSRKPDVYPDCRSVGLVYSG